MNRIPYSRQSVDESDIKAVEAVLRSDWLTQGPVVKKFEDAIAEYCKCHYAVAFTNASAALHAGCKALGLGDGDSFATSTITFAASANCGLHCGAEVTFIDVNPENGLMDLDSLEVVCDSNEKPKLVIPVHLAGNSVDMERLRAHANVYGFSILEDASHALGAKYNKKPIGICEYSEAAVFSLHPVKMITSGEGGLLVTNNPKIAESARTFREHGIAREKDLWKNDTESMGSWYYEVQELGFNYRLSDIQAALGKSQLKRLDSFVEQRRQIHGRYSESLDKKYWELVEDTSASKSSWHLCIAKLPSETSPTVYKEVFETLRSLGLYVNQHYIPLYRHPLYRNQNDDSCYPGSSEWARRAISIPCFPNLTDVEFQFAVKSLNETAAHFLA